MVEADSGASDPIDVASAGVQDLAGAATGVLDQAGPAGAVLQPVVDALRNVWEGYFGSPIPEGGTNWNAYTHEQLYQMLFQNADVGHVSSMAAEWGRHGSELSEHGEALRDQRGTLQSHWSGDAADPAADRLGEVGHRTSGAGARADTVGQATQGAGDALAVARSEMPPPPGDPTAAVLTGGVAGAGAGAAIGAIVGAGAGGIGAGPGALMGAAIGAVAGGGASLFLANVAAAQKKAEAVHVMQRYEVGLRNSSQAIAPAGVTTANDYGVTTAAGSADGTGAFGRGGASWGQLTGGDPLRSGGMAGFRASAAMENALARAGASLAASRAGYGSGMWPGAGMARGDDDTEHPNRLPTVNQRLFDVDDAASSSVIGL
jgi:hypothetical protein